LLFYVNDIVLTASTRALLQHTISALNQEFAMNDLDPFHHFWGVSVHHQADGLFLTQCQFTLDVLERAGMVDCKLVLTLMDTQAKVFVAFGLPITDLTQFRGLTGALYYLTFTRTDIAYIVQLICLHMHDTQEPHLTTMKRILHYLRGSLGFGLHL
jgi:hypothetical protein